MLRWLSLDHLGFGILLFMSPWSESSHASLPIFAFMLFSLKEIKAMNHLNEGRSTKYKMSLHQDSLLEPFSFIYLFSVPQFPGCKTTTCRKVQGRWILLQGAVFNYHSLTCASISAVFCLEVHEDLDTPFGCPSSVSLYIYKWGLKDSEEC